jgi:hypothetical protein
VVDVASESGLSASDRVRLPAWTAALERVGIDQAAIRCVADADASYIGIASSYMKLDGIELGALVLTSTSVAFVYRRGGEVVASLRAPDLAQGLAALGKNEVDQGPDPDKAGVLDTFALSDLQRVDRDELVAVMAGAVLPVGGFAVYGAAWFLCDTNESKPNHPDFHRIIAAAKETPWWTTRPPC